MHASRQTARALQSWNRSANNLQELLLRMAHLADTKFEFGVRGDELFLIDELFTPDSSRFWPQDGYQPGRSPPSFDKQFVRDYATTLG